MFEWIASPEAWIALATLTALEIVLGIDNIIFISILVARLPDEQRDRARRLVQPLRRRAWTDGSLLAHAGGAHALRSIAARR